MKLIYKYQIPFPDAVIDMPIGAEILSVQEQHGIPTMWALINDEVGTIKRKFSFYGTGHPIHIDNFKFLATIQRGKGLVWHVIEVL